MADQNQNPGSKQADGSTGKQMDKDSMGGSGGRTGSGTSKGSSAGSTDKSMGGQSAGSKNQSVEDESEDLSGESGSGKSLSHSSLADARSLRKRALLERPFSFAGRCSVALACAREFDRESGRGSSRAPVGARPARSTLARARIAVARHASRAMCRTTLPLVSVIVPARNEAHNIERCVRSILRLGLAETSR